MRRVPPVHGTQENVNEEGCLGDHRGTCPRDRRRLCHATPGGNEGVRWKRPAPSRPFSLHCRLPGRLCVCGLCIGSRLPLAIAKSAGDVHRFGATWRRVFCFRLEAASRALWGGCKLPGIEQFRFLEPRDGAHASEAVRSGGLEQGPNARCCQSALAGAPGFSSRRAPAGQILSIWT
jgi:hypothetical protein